MQLPLSSSLTDSRMASSSLQESSLESNAAMPTPAFNAEEQTSEQNQLDTIKELLPKIERDPSVTTQSTHKESIPPLDTRRERTGFRLSSFLDDKKGDQHSTTDSKIPQCSQSLD